MTTALRSTLATVLATAEQLQHAGAANEANTRAHVIEPLLLALGWGVNNFAEVDREFKVYDGTFLDYALRIDGKPKLFLEAKALGKSLNDKQFVAQTINYANNEGVVWCVLTDGLVYKVYKSNEPVGMENKLLFEVDLRDATEEGGMNGLVNSLQPLQRASVAEGHLDVWGEQVFTDVRVRSALATIAAELPQVLVDAVGGLIDGPAVPQTALRDSLQRLMLQSAAVPQDGALVGGPPPKPKASPSEVQPVVPIKKAYDISRHTANKPAGVVDLFQHVDAYAMSLGADVARRPTKYYIGYFAGKRSFITLELQKAKIYVYVSVPPSEVEDWSDAEMRDVTNVGHFGMGDAAFTLLSPEQLPRLEALIQQSYLRNRK